MVSAHCCSRYSIGRCLNVHTQMHRGPMSHLCVTYVCFPGVYAVPEGHQHVVCGRTDGGGGSGALEPAQTHCPSSAALCRGAPRSVSDPQLTNRPTERTNETTSQLPN